MSDERQLTGEGATDQGRRADRLSPLRSLLDRGGSLVRRAPEVVDRTASLVGSIRGALLPLHRGESEGEPESVSGFIRGHRVVAGARASRAAVALTFEGNGVRVLQHYGSRIVGWGEFPLETSVDKGEITDAAVLGDALDDLFDRAGLARRRVVGALSGRRASSALLEVPLLRREGELEEMVAEEAARHLGFSPRESYLFWERAARQRRSRLVFAVVVPQEPLLLMLEALEAARIQPDSLDFKPLALARAVNHRDAIVACLEPDGLDVVVVADDLPVAIRSAALPTGISASDAREALLGEVARSLAGYGGARALRDADAGIYLAGSLADEALGEQLRQQTGYQIGRVSPPVHYPADFPLGEQLANVGLALKRQ